MKKTFSILLCFLLMACSTSNDDHTPQIPTADVPASPVSLLGDAISDVQIGLSWKDNSQTETGFKIERKAGAASFTALTTLGANATTFNDTGLTPGTTYTYRVSSFNTIGASKSFSNEVTIITPKTITVPTIATVAVTSISNSGGVSGGTIGTDGGCLITAKGVVWDTNPNPTISLPTKVLHGTDAASFTSSITGLTNSTKYYVRAFATNAVGTVYGNELSFVTNPSANTIADVDGNTYKIIQIGEQKWMQSNLNVSKYRNGDPIPQVTSYSDWQKLTTGAWSYYGNKTENGIVYGKLYNWYAVNDPRGLAPEGYHIPTDQEWSKLAYFLGNEAGGKMKATTSLWNSPNEGATNSSGFNGLPGGEMGNMGFQSMGKNGVFWGVRWSDASQEIIREVSRVLTFDYVGLPISDQYKTDGLSVRCIKD